MMQQAEYEQIKGICNQFPLPGIWVGVAPYGAGHINDTYAVYYQLEDGKTKRYILQRINQRIFRDVEVLMNNITGVTDFLHGQIKAAGGDPWRETLNVLRTKTGQPYFTDEQKEAWRLYPFIENTLCLQLVSQPEDFYQSARAFALFQKHLAAYPAKELSETIPFFHDTPKRFRDFQAAVTLDTVGRAEAVAEEIAFVQQREQDCGILTDLLTRGELPLRVTHNDTKLNNVLLDENSRKAVCVIDLDTVMPGLCHYDFGDSIRFGASSAAEDEVDLTQVEMRLDLFTAYTKGYLEILGTVLSPKEIRYLAFSAKLMTLECGMRFLTDYLSGDIYFKTKRPGHNLDRARNQFKLVQDMEAKMSQMEAIVLSQSVLSGSADG